MADRSLDSLSSDFYPLACQWLARTLARGVPVLVVQTGRTPAEHQLNLAAGTSRVSLSMHLPRHLRWRADQLPCLAADLDKADAIDVVPYDEYRRVGPDKLSWDPHLPEWRILGEEAERLTRHGQPAARWGGKWHDPFDPGHLELAVPWTAEALARERARPWPNLRQV